jgi:hypothetical protein
LAHNGEMLTCGTAMGPEREKSRQYLFGLHSFRMGPLMNWLSNFFKRLLLQEPKARNSVTANKISRHVLIRHISASGKLQLMGLALEMHMVSKHGMNRKGGLVRQNQHVKQGLRSGSTTSRGRILFDALHVRYKQTRACRSL